ncbi:fibronectin type III domain-containing protein [Thermoactinospora rubra]|uniref:fibronectin type III domain-containing protein n=1 Tax=Thermoactinospora rubra TaxID=1088767 RepID=UPI000A12210D|nr:fibronectin type III domain-containing protein [Thermoactinospora rubra]
MRLRTAVALAVAMALSPLTAAGPAHAAHAASSSIAALAEWAPWTAYTAGQQVTYNGVTYQCLQSHTSQPGWEPPNVPALWKPATGGGDTTPPSAPGNLRVTGTTSSSVSLAWNAATDNVGVTGYNVYRGGTLVTTVTGTAYTDSGLSPSTSYTYTVRARDAAGNLSGPSNSVTGTTSGGQGVPGQPGAPSVTGVTNSSISLSWGASSGTVTGYRVYEGGTQRAQVTGTSAAISGLAACSTHTYTVRAYNSAGESAASAPVTGTTTGCTNPGRMPGAPYLYMGWGNPPNPGTVMDATGVKSFTMAFILSSGGCTPAWDGNRPLTGGPDQQAINTIKSKGGSVQISFGGWQGNKLGPNCSSPEAFAGAVQQVINAVGPAVVDFDIENTDEFENYTVQDRILNALKIVKANNPNVKIVVTFGTTRTGPNSHGIRLINRSKELGVPIDNYTIMPFDFGSSNIYTDTVNASEGLKNALKSAFGWSDAQAYARMGISGMNGLSDQQELTTPATWTQIRDWAKSKGLTRLAYWAVNRDRPCPGGGVTSNCSGIAQQDWEFTRITAGF